MTEDCTQSSFDEVLTRCLRGGVTSRDEDAVTRNTHDLDQQHPHNKYNYRAD